MSISLYKKYLKNLIKSQKYIKEICVITIYLMTEIVKKKRGRKPKHKNIDITKIEEKTTGKKRGRKPKIKVDNPKEQLIKLPKKRGRKPKEVVVTVQPNIIKEEPIILHLPLKNIESSNDIYIPKPFIDIDKFNSKFKNINNKKNIETTIDEVFEPNVINKFNKLCSEYSNVIERDKVFPIFLEFNEHNKKQKWPNSTNIDCLWCCHSFDSFPFGIPIKNYEDIFYMFGNFCSAECGAAYNFDNINTCESYERYSLINYLYSSNKEIKLAGPRLSIKKFGGQLSINEFRKNNNIYNKNYKLLIPPMISLIPLIEEVNLSNENINIDNNDNLFNLDSELKLKRSKPLPDNFNTLENCMNLKLV